jgi:hypothetical protein
MQNMPTTSQRPEDDDGRHFFRTGITNFLKRIGIFEDKFFTHQLQRKHKSKAQVVGKLLPLLFYFLFFSCSKGTNEPNYDGRSLSAWLSDYTHPLGDGDPRDPAMQVFVPRRLSVAQEAVKSIGSNAVPTLLRLIQSEDPQKRDMASAGFMIIGKDGSSALQSLKQLLTHKEARIRLLAADCIVFIDPADNTTLTGVFTQLARDSDATNRAKATNFLMMLSLGRIQSYKTKSVN